MNDISDEKLKGAPVSSSPKIAPEKKGSNLKTRLVSAAILAPIAIFLAYYNGATFLFLVAVFVVALSWEWGKMTRSNGLDHIAGLTLVTALTMMGTIVWKDLNLTWTVLALGALSIYFLTQDKKLWAVAGVFYIGLPASALVWLGFGEQYGFSAIAFIFFVVWTTDSASYGVGRLIGGVKFAPTISPNKTWAGFLGGIIGAAMMGGLFALWLGNTSPKTLAVVAFMVAIASQYGDLLESSVKRHHKIKDSSQLIPGHGGAFDRLDGLLSAVMMAALIALFRGGADPAQSLLVW